MNIPPIYFETYAFIVGLCVGSFLNVVIYRMPMNMSVVTPGSHCPECGTPIRARDNIPLLGWALLMGQCRDCGVTISSRYFMVELLTGVLTWAVASKFGITIETLLYLLLVWALIAVTYIDFDFQIIPDEITVYGAVFGLAVSPMLPIGFQGALFGAVLGGGIFYLLAMAYPGGMGGGDIKLMAAIGAFLGWKLVLLTIILASILGASVGIIAMLAFGKGRKDRIPFGPFLAIAALISLLWGDQIISLYMTMFT